VYARDADRIILVASQGGMPRHPIWYLNLTAHPDVEFQVGSERRSYRVREVEGEERERCWQIACEAYSGFDAYQKRTERRIPVLLLEPR
jgi:deazaflavin-dependent oxidoreductase (nitroreductase family)